MSPGGSALKTRAEQVIEARAINAINEYRLVKSGAATYERLGYEVPGGGPAALKLIEFLAIDGEVQRAEADRDREHIKKR